MVFLAGIDEAGYGPFIGPLTLGYTIFRVPHKNINLWESLDSVVAKKALRKDRRIWVNDSKKVNVGPYGRKRMERTVAAFSQLLKGKQITIESWITTPPCGNSRWLHETPWFNQINGFLCPNISTDRALFDAMGIHQRLQSTGCTIDGFGARAVTAGEWNQLILQTKNKGDALFLIAIEIIKYICNTTGHAPLRIELDGQSGRTKYAKKLQKSLNPEQILIHNESKQESAYSLTFGRREVQLRFSRKADQSYFPVALASMAAKQTRERMMDFFNDWWQGNLPGIQPTKGYGVDGKRWLSEVMPKIKRLEIPERLIRRKR